MVSSIGTRRSIVPRMRCRSDCGQGAGEVDCFETSLAGSPPTRRAAIDLKPRSNRKDTLLKFFKKIVEETVDIIQIIFFY